MHSCFTSSYRQCTVVRYIAELKARYDKYDEEGLKGGVPLSDGNFSQSYVFHGNSELIFREFFGGNNPFSGMFSNTIIYALISHPPFQIFLTMMLILTLMDLLHLED